MTTKVVVTFCSLNTFQYLSFDQHPPPPATTQPRHHHDDRPTRIQLSHPELDASVCPDYPPTNGSAFWGDTVLAPRQLVEFPNARFDFLIGDLRRRSISNQLSSNFEPEVTMGLLACRSRLVSKRNLPSDSTDIGLHRRIPYIHTSHHLFSLSS